MQINQDSAAFISGGASGLGFATAARLAGTGARVAILDVNEDTGKAAAASIGGLFIPTDVTDPQSVAAALDTARAALAEALGPEAIAGASAIAGNFTKNDRVANALGIPVDPPVLKGTEDLREQLGLNDYASAWNTFRHI